MTENEMEELSSDLNTWVCIMEFGEVRDPWDTHPSVPRLCSALEMLPRGDGTLCKLSVEG